MLEINKLNNSKVFCKKKSKNAVTYKRVTKRSPYFEKHKKISSIENEFTLTPNYNQVLRQKEYQQLIRLAYYQAGKTVVQTLLPQHPPVSLIMLNPIDVTSSISADISIPSDPTWNTQWCSSLESRLIGLYGGKATSQLFEYEYGRMSFYYNHKNNLSGINPLFCTFQEGSILPHTIPPSNVTSLQTAPYHLGWYSKGGKKMVYDEVTSKGDKPSTRMVQQLDESNLFGYFQKRSQAIWKNKKHLEACSPQHFSSVGKKDKTSLFQKKRNTNLINEFQNLIAKLKNKRAIPNFSTTLARMLSSNAKTSFEKNVPTCITSLGDHVITLPRTICPTYKSHIFASNHQILPDTICASANASPLLPSKLVMKVMHKRMQKRGLYCIFQKNNIKSGQSFGGAGNNFFQSNIGAIEIQTATRLASLMVNNWNFYSVNTTSAGEIEDTRYAQHAALFEQNQCNKFIDSEDSLIKPKEISLKINNYYNYWKSPYQNKKKRLKKFKDIFLTQLFTPTPLFENSLVYGSKKSISKADKSSYSNTRISIENVKTKQFSNVGILNFVNSFQFSNVQRDRFSLGWFRLYLPDIEATAVLKNAANYFFNLSLQTLIRPSTSKLNSRLYSSAFDFKFAWVDQLSKESKRSNIFFFNNINRRVSFPLNTTKLNEFELNNLSNLFTKKNLNQIISILSFNLKVKTSFLTGQKIKEDILKDSQNAFICLLERETTNNLRIGLGLLRSMAKRRNQLYHRPVKSIPFKKQEVFNKNVNKKNVPHLISLIGDKIDKINVKREQLSYLDLDVSSFLLLEKQIFLKGYIQKSPFDDTLQTPSQHNNSALPLKLNKNIKLKRRYVHPATLYPKPHTYKLLILRNSKGGMPSSNLFMHYHLLTIKDGMLSHFRKRCLHTKGSKGYDLRWYAEVMLSNTNITKGSNSTIEKGNTGLPPSEVTSKMVLKRIEGGMRCAIKYGNSGRVDKQKKRSIASNFVKNVSHVEKELIYRALINNSFTKAFLLINKNRQLLDYFVDYLIRFQIIRQHQILYLFSAILLNCKKYK